MNKAEDLWNILTWLGVERRSFYSFRNAYCTMGGFGGYKVIGYKNLDSLNAELNTVMLRRKKEEVLDLPPKLYSTEYVELTTAQKKQYRDIKNGIVADMENILASVNPLNCTLRLRQLTSGNPNLTDDSPKLDRIKEMLEEEIIPNGHKAIIFSQWSTIATGKRVYTRKEVADLVGASTQSIRLWEDAGAIPASVRDEGGYRYWYEEDLEAIKAYASLPRKAKLKK